MEDIDSPHSSVRPCPILQLGDQPIVVTEFKRIDQDRTVYRAAIAPVDGLPSILIIKQEKEGWSDEFETEAAAYVTLEGLQGNVIPQFFGRASFDGTRALVFSEVVGTTLLAIARSNKVIDEKALRDKLTAVFQSLSANGVIYWDQKLDNFMYCDDGNPETSKVMVVDFEQVELPTATSVPSWKQGINREGARALLEDFRDIRDRISESTRARFRRPENGDDGWGPSRIIERNQSPEITDF